MAVRDPKRNEIPEFTKELDLEGLIVVNKKEKDGDVVYFAESSSIPTCINCRTGSHFRVHDKRESKIYDLPRFGKRTGILLTRKRYVCTYCGYNTSDVFPGIDGRMTKRLRDVIKKETLFFPFTDLAEKYGVSSTTVNKLFQEMSDECARRYKPKVPDVMGIVRLPMHRGKTFYTAVIDVGLDDGTVVELSNAASKQGAEACFERMISNKNLHLVISDLYSPYRDAIREMFDEDIGIVVDKHYVLQLLRSSFDRIRLDIQKKYTGRKMSRSFSQSRFLTQTDYYTLDKRREQHMNQLLDECPELRDPYELKEAFVAIYDADNSDTATSQYREWKKECLSLGVKGYYGFIDTVDSLEKEVFRYFDTPDYYAQISNAVSKVQEIDREGYRYKYEVLRAKALYRNLHSVKRSTRIDFDQFQ